jgi:periplasmic protein TonB
MSYSTASESIHAPDQGRADDEGSNNGRGTLRQYVTMFAIGLGAIVLIGFGIRLFLSGDDLPPPRKVQEITLINIVPPPPPPPPPPKVEEKMIEQTPVRQEIQDEKPVEKPKEAPPEPKDSLKDDEPPPGPLALDAKAVGPGDSSNLGGKPGGHGLLGGGGGGGGSRWGWYASIVQQQIEAALRANAHTRNAVMQIQVRLWADSSGRVSRIQLVSSTGNPEMDAAIRDEVLQGIMLREPPPKDMPMPIVTRVTARKQG